VLAGLAVLARTAPRRTPRPTARIAPELP
jgi:hypothetical protein